MKFNYIRNSDRFSLPSQKFSILYHGNVFRTEFCGLDNVELLGIAEKPRCITGKISLDVEHDKVTHQLNIFGLRGESIADAPQVLVAHANKAQALS